MKFYIAFLTFILIGLSKETIAQNETDKKILKASSDSIHADMIITNSDDIIFILYDQNNKKIKLDSISGTSEFVFHYDMRLPVQVRKLDIHRIVATVEDFNGYIRFIKCELTLLLNKNKLKLVFINK